ncbi:MAG: hypothetical protein ABR927_07045 [Bacteroidales bacterium]|jgi:hypothetical protein
MHKQFISIWFFIGTLLTIYGGIILTANIFEAVTPSSGNHIVLKELNFGIWWGALLIIVGLLYFISFRPWKKR